MTTMERLLPAMAELFRKDAEIEEIPITSIEGHEEQGKLSLKVLMTTKGHHFPQEIKGYLYSSIISL